jgi:hypothetical protein
MTTGGVIIDLTGIKVREGTVGMRAEEVQLQTYIGGSVKCRGYLPLPKQPGYPMIPHDAYARLGRAANLQESEGFLRRY